MESVCTRGSEWVNKGKRAKRLGFPIADGLLDGSVGYFGKRVGELYYVSGYNALGNEVDEHIQTTDSWVCLNDPVSAAAFMYWAWEMMLGKGDVPRLLSEAGQWCIEVGGKRHKASSCKVEAWLNALEGFDDTE